MPKAKVIRTKEEIAERSSRRSRKRYRRNKLRLEHPEYPKEKIEAILDATKELWWHRPKAGTKFFLEEAQEVRGKSRDKRVKYDWSQDEGKADIQKYNPRLAKVEAIKGKLVDTRNMDWEDWVVDYLSKQCFNYQITTLYEMEEGLTMFNHPRQHGKTAYTVEPFLTRKNAETVFLDFDTPYVYISHALRNVKAVVLSVKNNLVFNPAILENYGLLIDLRKFKGQSLVPQTQVDLNLITKKDRMLTSLRGGTIEGGIRGSTSFHTIIDDPVDIKEEINPEKATIDFFNWLNAKIIPLTKGNMTVIGTKYMKGDIYELIDEKGIFKYRVLKAILSDIPGYTLPERRVLADGTLQQIKAHEIKVDGNAQVELLAPSLWEYDKNFPLRSGNATQNILIKHHWMGERIFLQELQNDPQPLNTTLMWEWIVSEDRPMKTSLGSVATHWTWAVFQDTATGEGKGSDYNAFVLMGKKGQEYIIFDILSGKWTPMVRMRKLEEFISNNANKLGIAKTSIKFSIEVVRTSGSDFFQLVRDNSWVAPHRITPRGRGQKVVRITANLGGEMEIGRVKLWYDCSEKAKLRREMDGFPTAKHEHILDAADQCLYQLKIHGSGIYIPNSSTC